MPDKPWGLAVRAMIGDRRGRCLVLRRHRLSRHFPGCWEYPGGKVDPGETIDAALRREVREETGLTVAIEGFEWASEFEFPGIRAVMIVMRARQVRGRLRLSDEHEEFRWVTKQAMRTLELSPQMAATPRTSPALGAGKPRPTSKRRKRRGGDSNPR